MAGREGTRFGPYQLTRRLGGGAAGEVYLAEGGPTLPSSSGSGSTKVAIKILSGSANDSATRDIARQVELAGSLHQPHFIPFYGLIADDGALGVSMAFAPGGSLGDALDGHGVDGAARVTLPLAAPVAARLTVQLARALDAAHALGLVHADLKPNNVFVRTSSSGSPLTVLSDFGQGVLTQSAVALVSQGNVAPSRQTWVDAQLRFAAPEQIQGAAPTPLTDQYSLAALAYLMLVGEPPIVGNGPALLQAIVAQPVSAPSQRNPRLPASLDAVLLRALAKEPAQRFPAISAFAEALDEVLAAPASVPMQRGRVTAGMAQLSGAHPAAPGASASRSMPGATSTSASGASYSSLGSEVSIPAEDASPGVNRRLAIIAGSAMLLVVLSCILVFRAFTGGAILPQIHLGGVLSSNNATATPRANATATAVANSAQDRLRAATTGQPQFQDGLTSNTHQWQTSANKLFFAKDGYHLTNPTSTTILTVNVPGAQPSDATLVVRADLVISQGTVNVFAGLRAFVSPTGDCYAFLVSPQGKYQAWKYLNGGWTLLLDGFVGKFNVGLGAKNTIEVLADSQNVDFPQAWLFVNGQYVNSISLDPQGPTAGGAGLIVKDGATEAVFSNFAIYGSGG